MIMLEGADYAEFSAKFERETPQYLREFGFGDERSIDIKKLMTESFRFSSSIEPGLELVDIVTNATRRALHGNLRQEGWRDIPRLMMHRGEQYIKLVRLSQSSPYPSSPPYAKVLLHGFAHIGRPMIPPSNRD
jgi:hypothetical protein